jgi:hypothetical protein
MHMGNVRLRQVYIAMSLAVSVPLAVFAADDGLRIEDVVAKAGSVARVPVYVRDVSSTTLNADGVPIRSIAFRASFTNAAFVQGCVSTQVPECDMTFTPGGVLSGLTPASEDISTGANSISVAYEFGSNVNIPFTIDKADPGDLIGYIELQLSSTATNGSTMVFSVDSDPGETALGNGSQQETVGSGLDVGGGTLTVSDCTTAPTSQTVFMTWSGTGCSSPNASCAAGPVTFTATAFNYQFQACDVVSWDFGDQNAGSGQTVTHTYGAGSFKVTMTVTNPSGSVPISQQFTFSNVAGDGCPALTQSNVAATWSGDGCSSPDGTCPASSQIVFTVRATSDYDFSCGIHTFAWNFGDGAHSTGKTVNHEFQEGTYNISVVVTSPTSSITLSTQVRVSGDGAGGGCPPLEPDVNVYVHWFGDGCSPGIACGALQPITFDVVTFGYDFSCGSHTFAWDFDDGAHATARTVTHSFAQNGTYNVSVRVASPSSSVTLTARVAVGSGEPANTGRRRAVRP